jgi:hypothetical protein
MALWNSYVCDEFLVTPTENDVCRYVGSGYGRVLQEQYFGKFLKQLCFGGCGVIPQAAGDPTPKEWSLPASSESITKNMAGIAVVSGYLIMPQDGGDVGVTLKASATSYVYLVIHRDVNGKASYASVDVYDAMPASVEDGLLLGVVVSGASTVTTCYDCRSTGRVSWGRIKHLSGGSSKLITLHGSADWYLSIPGGGGAQINFSPAFFNIPNTVMVSGSPTVSASAILWSTTYEDTSYQFMVSG